MLGYIRGTVCAVAVALLVMASGAGANPGQKRCDRHLSDALAHGRQALVYRSSGDSITYGCLRAGGRSVRLGPPADVGFPYASSTAVGGTNAAAAFDNEGVVSSCYRYHDPSCPPLVYAIDFVALRSHRVGEVHVTAAPSRLVVSPDSALAWVVQASSANGVDLYATPLRPEGRSGLSAKPRIIDTGTIAPSSVRFNGRVLSWTKNGKHHRKSIR